jgi:hypothetical protein
MSKRKNTFTRFIEDIVDDSKDFVDDILDRAKDLETDAKDAVKDVVEDDEKGGAGVSSMASLESALAELTAKVNELAAVQLAAASAPAPRKAASASSAAA